MLSAFRQRPAPGWLLWVLILLVAIQLFGYLNLEIRYKYEVDIAKTLVEINPPTATAKQQVNQQYHQRGREIREAQFRRLLYAALAAGTAVVLGLHNNRLPTATSSSTAVS